MYLCMSIRLVLGGGASPLNSMREVLWKEYWVLSRMICIVREENADMEQSEALKLWKLTRPQLLLDQLTSILISTPLVDSTNPRSMLLVQVMSNIYIYCMCVFYLYKYIYMYSIYMVLNNET
jgi:hypothetical protein